MKRTVILAILGLVTVGAGAGLGLWLTKGSPHTAEGIPSARKDSPEPEDGGVHEHETSADPPATPATSHTTHSAPAGQTASRTERIARHVVHGDNALRIGDYQRAISSYRYVLQMTDGAAEASVRYRLALSSECSGALDEALEQYQTIAQKFSLSNWNDLSQLGRVRCLARLNRSDALIPLVYRSLLDNTVLVAPVRRDVLHEAAQGFCRRLLRQRRTDILSPRTLVLSASDTDPNQVLSELAAMVTAEPSRPGDPTLRLLQRIDDHPDNIYLKVHARRAPVQSLMKRLTAESELRFHLSPSARDTIGSRQQTIHADDIRLSLLLDGLCVPFGLVWTARESDVYVQTEAETSEEARSAFTLARVDRLLQAAIFTAPNSRQLPHTRIAQGCLLFETGRIPEAAHVFRKQLQSDQAPELDIEAAFNLGKCHFLSGQLRLAEEAWYRCVDSGGRDRVTIGAAYICIGRLQLEDGRFQKAAVSLGRAAELTAGTPLEQQAAALLGSAYLLDGHPSTANTAMFVHRESMEDPDVRAAVAFASAFARYQVAALQDRRNREAADVVTTLSQLHPERQFGAHWFVLAAQACEELGLADQAISYYLKASRVLRDGDLRQAVMLRLAGRYRDEQKLPEALQLLAHTKAEDGSALAFEIALQSAEIHLQSKQSDRVIELCTDLLQRAEDPETRRRALKLAGRAFEQRALRDGISEEQRHQDYEAAVRCFSGMLPDVSAAGSRADTAVHGEQS